MIGTNEKFSRCFDVVSVLSCPSANESQFVRSDQCLFCWLPSKDKDLEMAARQFIVLTFSLSSQPLLIASAQNESEIDAVRSFGDGNLSKGGISAEIVQKWKNF